MDWTKANNYNQKHRTEISDEQLSKLTALWQSVFSLSVDGMCGPVTRLSIDEATEGDLPVPPSPSESYEFVVQELDDGNIVVTEVNP